MHFVTILDDSRFATGNALSTKTGRSLTKTETLDHVTFPSDFLPISRNTAHDGILIM